MIDDLKYYLLVMRLRVEGIEDKELMMTEISAIAIKNWVDRENGDPNLTKEQFSKATRRVIAKKGYSGSN